MNPTKFLKQLLSQSLEREQDLSSLIEECFKEIFKDRSIYALSLLEDDLDNGKNWDRCLQPLGYYKNRIAEEDRNLEEYKKKKKVEEQG